MGNSGISRESIERVFGSAFLEGNRIELLKGGSGAFDSIISSIRKARSSLCLQFYIFRNDETGAILADELKKCASRGVKVYLLHDHLGSLMTPHSFWQGLRESGVHVRAAHPFVWGAPLSYYHRDHRKLIIIDCRKAFTGGLNIANEYWGLKPLGREPWRDTAVIIEGPAAKALLDTFLKAWAGWTKRVPPPIIQPCEPEVSGRLPVLPIVTQAGRVRRRMRNLIGHCIRNASNGMSLSTAYFIPSRRLIRWLSAAVARGVRVRLLVPGRSDVTPAYYAARYFYSRLLKAGVEIYEYSGEMLHAKTYVFDNTFSIVGSANLDYRSLWLNDEGNVGIFDPGFAHDMMGLFEADLENSRRIMPEEWALRPIWSKILEFFFSRFRRRL
jgi:cardiolipin synthase